MDSGKIEGFAIEALRAITEHLASAASLARNERPSWVTEDLEEVWRAKTLLVIASNDGYAMTAARMVMDTQSWTRALFERSNKWMLLSPEKMISDEAGVVIHHSNELLNAISAFNKLRKEIFDEGHALAEKA